MISFTASLLTQLLGIFLPEFEDLSVMTNGLQGLVGCGPQLVLQITLFLHGLDHVLSHHHHNIDELNSCDNLVQTLNIILSIMVICRSVVMYDVLYKEGTTSNRAATISLSKKLLYSIQVSSMHKFSYLRMTTTILSLLCRYNTEQAQISISDTVVICAIF